VKEDRRKMKRKGLIVIFASMLLFSGAFIQTCFQLFSGYGNPPPNVDTLIADTIGEPWTIDPAWCYDTAGAEIIFNTYETLTFFNVNRSVGVGIEEMGETDEFVPLLASELTPEEINETSPVEPWGTPMNWTYRYYFKIRGTVEGHPTWNTEVWFHDGSNLTTADVEYSFERLMVTDPPGGSTWMIFEPLTSVYATPQPGYWHHSMSQWALVIDQAVQKNDTHVWFNLVMSYEPFLQIISQPWASILNKEWCLDSRFKTVDNPNGNWNGSWTQWTLWNFVNNTALTISPIDEQDTEPPGPNLDAMMGTGPYKLDYWEKTVEWSIVKYDDYWQGWPAPKSPDTLPRYFTRFTEKLIEDWDARKNRLIWGQSDLTVVPREFIGSLMATPGWTPGDPEVYLPWIRCSDPAEMLALEAMFFNFNISTTSTYCGSGFDPNNPTQFGEDRIPINLFQDNDTRMAFAYAFDYSAFIEDAFLDEASTPANPHIKGLPYYNQTIHDTYRYDNNLTKAKELFETAWSGDLKTYGMSFSLVYNEGNLYRETACYAIKEVIEDIGDEIASGKFHVTVLEVSWEDYGSLLRTRVLPMFIIGWLADYPDPHDFVHPFMHSRGAFGSLQSIGVMPFSNTLDSLVEAGIATIVPSERQAIYNELGIRYHEYCPSVPLAQPLGRHWERDWVQGWYYNPIYGGSFALGLDSVAPCAPCIYVYHLWKAWTGDINLDDVVDVFDMALVGGAFGATYNATDGKYWHQPPDFPEPCPYCPHPAVADVNNDGVVNIYDKVIVGYHFGSGI